MYAIKAVSSRKYDKRDVPSSEIIPAASREWLSNTAYLKVLMSSISSIWYDMTATLYDP